ncbi:MAG: hypothetical protein FWH35_03015 [Treponema sp.]|nr:hypothetical protein [Treponema sp.]
MKKVLLFGLALLLLSTALFADDAKVMPMRVGRFYLAPTFSFAPGAYDADGKYQKYDDGSVKLFNLGFALEYGIINWITAAVQWAPGVTVWSDVSSAAPASVDSLLPLVNKDFAPLATSKPLDGDLTANGVADLFVGFKFQIVGSAAPVKTEMFRFAIAPGIKIPLPGPDFDDEVENALAGDKAKFSKMDNHSLGVGGRVYFDYNINEKFFINLYNETLFYPIKQDLNKDGPNLAILKETVLTTAYDLGYALTFNATKNATIAAAAGDAARTKAQALTDGVSGEVNYKYQTTFEIEPVFTTPIADGVSLSAGLPINFLYIPAYEYSVDGIDELLAGFTAMLPAGTELPIDKDGLLEKGNLVGDAAYSLSLKPNVSVFLTKIFLPLEFKLQYQVPVLGKNVMARQNLTMQIKAYFKI